MNTISPTTHEVRGMVAQLKSAMSTADKNRDGRLDRVELAEAIRQAGGDRAHVNRSMILGKLFTDSFSGGTASVRGMGTRLENLGNTVIKADLNQNNRIAYGEMVELRKKDTTGERSYQASILWNAARGF